MEIPRCKNRACSDSNTVLLQETDMAWTFACINCKGIEVRSKPLAWRAGQQVKQYRQYGRPEYARNKVFFFQGRNRGAG